jgi:hypothetical protein
MKNISKWATAITILIVFTTITPTFGEDYCASRPPPEGLVARCQKLDMVVIPSNKADLSIKLAKWMQTCAKRERGDSLVFGNESVDYVWGLIENKLTNSSSGGVRIVPQYEANQFTNAGRTCYGIASVKFAVAGAQGEVDIDSDFDIKLVKTFKEYPEQIIKDAVTEGELALQEYPGDNEKLRSRMLNVLKSIKSNGSEFNDTYYAVAPYKNIGGLNDPTCYKDFSASKGYVCRGLDDARKSCKRELGPRIIELHLNGASPKYMSEALLNYASDIDRGLHHLLNIQSAGTQGAVPCKSVEEVFLPEIGRMAQKAKTLYNAWDAAH